jgi:four helix bundle suffix protein
MNPVKKLLTYRYAEIIQDLTVEFVRKYIDYHSRTKDQMEQAARSGKQNIVEGVGQSNTSKKGEIKLLGVAKASFEELLSDYEDYLRQHQLPIYAKNDSRISAFRQIGYRLSSLSNLSDLGNLKEKPVLPETPAAAANFLLTLCHLVTFLLDRQIESSEEKFIKEGGFSENLFQSRYKYLKNLK